MPARKKKSPARLNREIADALARPRTRATRSPRHLLVEYDVTKLSKREIGSLEGHATAQSDVSEYDIGHPAVPCSSKLKTTGKRRVLVVDFDVTDLSEDQIGILTGEAVAQGEGADGGLWIDGKPTIEPYPSVQVTTKIV